MPDQKTVWVVTTPKPDGSQDLEVLGEEPRMDLLPGQQVYVANINGGDSTLMPDKSGNAIVEIPGTLTAHYDATGTEGCITGWVWMPHASNAGHFGPAAVVFEGDESLDVESVDGPFWRAVQRSLADGDFNVDWQE